MSGGKRVIYVDLSKIYFCRGIVREGNLDFFFEIVFVDACCSKEIGEIQKQSVITTQILVL